MARKNSDNVIYVNFGARSTTPSAHALDSAPDYAAQLPEGQSLAGSILMEALARDTDTGRINRGRSYAANNMVTSCTLSPGTISGIVAGSQPTPFSTTLSFAVPTAAQANAAATDLAGTPGTRDALYERLSGPEVVSFVLGARRWEQPLPKQIQASVSYDCDCPDFGRGHVCKHCVAVAVIAAGFFDKEPLRILDLTHLSVEQVSKAHGAAQATLKNLRRNHPKHGDASPTEEEFWQGGALPQLPTLSVRNTLQEGDNTALRAALRHVTYARLEELRVIDELHDIFDTITDSASFDDPESGLLADGEAWGGYTRFGSVDDLPEVEDDTADITASEQDTTEAEEISLDRLDAEAAAADLDTDGDA